jgi:hypothetical protein
MSEVTEYYNLNDSYLLILLKEEKFGCVSKNLNPFHRLWSSPKKRSQDRRRVRNVFDAARNISEDLVNFGLSFTSNQELVISNRK